MELVPRIQHLGPEPPDALVPVKHAGQRTHRSRPVQLDRIVDLVERAVQIAPVPALDVALDRRDALLGHVGDYRQPASASAATGSDGGTRSQRAGRFGSHQFHFPKSDTMAGTSSALITVASNRMPAARPVAIIFVSVPGPDPIETNARNRISAALVTRRPVRPIPCTTAVRVEPVRSNSSRMRARMNTS